MAQLLCNEAFYNRNIPVDPGELIKYSADKNSFDNTIIIAPTGKLVRKFSSDAILTYFEANKKPVKKPKIFTLSALAKYCFDKIPDSSSFRIISDAYRLALFEEASENASLNFFAKKGRTISPVILQRLADIIYGLKEDGISFDDFHEDIQTAEEIKNEDYDIPKMKDIAALYREYEKLLGDKFLDNADLINYCSEYYRNADSGSPLELFPSEGGGASIEGIFNNDTVILFHGFSEFKQPEINFISLFADSKVAAGIHIDYSPDNGPLFSNIENSIIFPVNNNFKLYSIDNDNNFIKLEKKSPKPATRRDYLRRWLFNTEKEIKNDLFSESITIMAAESRLREVKSIVKLARYLILKKNYKPSDICISMRQPDIYTGLFREVCEQYKVPANISDRYALANSSVSSAVFSLLDIVTKGYRRKDLQKALMSSYLDFDSATKTENGIDGVNLINAALKLRIIGGSRRNGAFEWKSRFRNYIDFKYFSRDELSSSNSPDAREISAINKDIISAKKALTDFNEISAALAWRTKKLPIGDFCEMIKRDILQKFRIKEKILEVYNIAQEKSTGRPESERLQLLEKIEQDSRAFSAIIALLDEMEFIMNDRDSERTFSLDELVTRFRAALIGAKFQIREKQSYGVEITAIEQTRGMSFPIMILCGNIDGEFPMAYKPETFLGKELPGSEERHKQSERMLFYQFLANGSFENRKIIFTYPKADETAEFVRSPFIDALLKITTLNEDGRIYDLSNLDKEQAEKDDCHPLHWIDSIANNIEALQYICSEKIKEGCGETAISENVNINISGEAGLEYLFNYLKENKKITDGLIDLESLDEDVADKLDEFRDKSWSITELETYASCPFKYFLKYLLRIQEPDDYGLTLSPLEKGSLLHLILYSFYTELQTDPANIEKINGGKLSAIALDPKKYDYYYQFLLETAKKEIERIRFEHPFFEIEENEILGGTNFPGYLKIWLTEELKRVEAGWPYKPALFELGFGSSKAQGDKKQLPPIEIYPGLKINGKIDRIEFLNAGDGLEFIIADYKSSLKSTPDNKKVWQGKAFQVALYLAAAENIFSGQYKIEARPAGGCYYALKPEYINKAASYKSHKFIMAPKDSPLAGLVARKTQSEFVKDYDEMNTLIAESIKMAAQIVNQISEGYFPVEPTSAEDCRRCSFKAVCRVDVPA